MTRPTRSTRTYQSWRWLLLAFVTLQICTESKGADWFAFQNDRQTNATLTLSPLTPSLAAAIMAKSIKAIEVKHVKHVKHAKAVKPIAAKPIAAKPIESDWAIAPTAHPGTAYPMAAYPMAVHPVAAYPVAPSINKAVNKAVIATPAIWPFGIGLGLGVLGTMTGWGILGRVRQVRSNSVLMRDIMGENAVAIGEAGSGLVGSNSSQMQWSQAPEGIGLTPVLNGLLKQWRTCLINLDYAVHHDVLTGLTNRSMFESHLHEVISRHGDPAPSHHLFAVLFLDLDHFRWINNSFGHQIGDRVLTAVAERLRDCLRLRASQPSQAELARFGGDEFIILLDPIQNVTEATGLADRIAEAFTYPFQINGHEIFVTASIGLSLSTTAGNQAEQMIRNADIALHQAKANGRDCYEVFDPAMHAMAIERLQIETDLRWAIQRNEFELHYQPIINAKTFQIQGFEALLRWNHPTQGLISPNRFIPLAEETGLILPIGWWVLRQACWQMRLWQAEFVTHTPLVMSVNLSSQQFARTDLIQQIEQILQETGLNPTSLKLEITESMAMQTGETMRARLRRLQKKGIQLSIDDFGTGYSSLSYLHRLPADTLKIDRSFISCLDSKGGHSDIVEAISGLAHKLGMDIVAEGVETIEQFNSLRLMGCEQVQGHLFSSAVTAAEAGALLMMGLCRVVE